MSLSPFRERIRSSIANQTLQAALDANAERRMAGRLTAMASLPDWRERRQRAHAIRADVIEHLAEYLDRFIQKVAANGISVHRAGDAAEAIHSIIDIINGSRRIKPTHLWKTKPKNGNLNPSALNSLLVAKSKSMVSEEINLNHALEAQGIRVVETDLGEYIVQLRGERPSHIITPAVHLRRQEVGRLFEQKLGIPYTEDIPTLTNTARRVLREVFLTADVGLSGVNFGVVESGTLCIVTNEGNGRMVTTLPPVHIALMGMERLLPTMDDLALLLSLLPRSATSQKLSVYTQLLHKPLDGQQRHLILLDNGRSALRSSPLAEALYCIRCGACLNACPVFREVGGHAYASIYPGPIGSVISAGLFGSEFAPLAQASTLCGACKDACPVDIDLPKLLIRVRAGNWPSNNQSVGASHPSSTLTPLSRISLKAYSLIAGRPRLFVFSQRLTALATNLAAPFNHWIRLPSVSGWGSSKDFPSFSFSPLRSIWNRIVPAPNKVSGASKIESAIKGTWSAKPLKSDSSDIAAYPVDTRSSDTGSEMSLSDLFMEELVKVSGHVIKTTSFELSRSLLGFLKSRGIQRLFLEPEIITAAELAAESITAVNEPDPEIKVGLTRALCGLADTGSILVADGTGQPLHASLLPEIHIAVLNVSDLLPSLADALNKTWLRESKSAVVITGPSRTGDIEMSHTIGVHGPGELIVFLVDE